MKLGEQFVSPETAAAEVGVTAAQIYEAIGRGKLQAVRPTPRCIRVTLEDVKAWTRTRRSAKPARQRVDPTVLMVQPTVYRLLDAEGALLYVGSTNNVGSRLRAHAADKAWWPQVSTVEVDHFDTMQKALKAEAKAIRSERPRHNIALQMSASERAWIDRRKACDSEPIRPRPRRLISVDPERDRAAAEMLERGVLGPVSGHTE